MNKGKRSAAIILALLAAVFYAVNAPFSKLLLKDIEPTFMAAFLYLGAGIGIGIMYLFRIGTEDRKERLARADLPYAAAMIVLDIVAPILLMMGINYGSASNAALLSNFEIVVTALIALIVFKEAVTKRLWVAIFLITVSSILLSFEGDGSFQFSTGSLLVILATCCWGLENNCTRRIAHKSTYEIVVIKGLFAGGGAFAVALAVGETMPSLKYIGMALLLGLVSYGLSIFLYIRAQRELGAAKTSAYYATAPFVGTVLAVVIIGERPTPVFYVALVIMVVGTAFVIRDTLMTDRDR